MQFIKNWFNRTFKANVNVTIHLKEGDITKQKGAVVNAANSVLLGGGGVDGAIHRAAGKGLLNACRQIKETLPDGLLPTGEAVITSGFNMSEYVIHVVGPIYDQHEADKAKALLASCYTKALDLAEAHNVQTISFPAISTGVYGYPFVPAQQVAKQAIQDWVLKQKNKGATLNMQIYLVYFGELDFKNAVDVFNSMHTTL